MIYLYMYSAVDHNKSLLSQQSLIISTLLSSFTLQTQQHLLKISQGTNVALLLTQSNYSILKLIIIIIIIIIIICIINFKINTPVSSIFINCILLSVRKKNRRRMDTKKNNINILINFTL